MKTTWYRWKFIVLLLPTFLGLASAAAQESGNFNPAWLTTADVLEKTQAKASNLRSLSGRFRQVRHSRLLSRPMESEGIFQWMPPERFRWEVTHPVPMTAVASGDSLLLLYPDLRRARLFRHPSGTSILGRISGVAGNVESFKEMYYLRLLPSTESKDSERVTLSLVPRSSQQDRFVKELKVTVTVSTWLPEKIEILEPSDGSTTIWLGGLVENTPLDEALFSLNPPPDVEFERLGDNRQP